MKRLVMNPSDTGQFSRIARGLNFFATMNLSMLEAVLQGLGLFAFERGEKVCVQGGAGDSFFVIQEGTLSVSSKNGVLSFSKRVAVLEEGDCFGEMALLRQTPRNATVARTTPSRIFVLPAQHFQTVVEQNPVFAAELRSLATLRQLELNHRYG